MQKTIRYFCKNEIPQLKKIVNDSPNKCSKYKFIENKLCQELRKEGSWEIVVSVRLQMTALDEKFFKYVTSTIAKAHEEVPSIKTSDPNESQRYGVKLDGKIDGVVYGLIDKIFNENNQGADFGIFDFVASLLYRIVKAHAFHNGNKRTAILSISYILNVFGFYIMWSNDHEKYIKIWEQLMLFVASSDDSESTITKKIKQKFLKSTWLKL